MPEVWINFDKPDKEISKDEDLYLDIRVLDHPLFEKVATQSQIPPLSDLQYISDEAWDELQEAMPEGFRGEKDPKFSEYYDCRLGFEWCDTIEAFVNQNEEKLDSNWDQKTMVLECIADFRKVLELAEKAGAKFNLIFGS